VGIASAGKGRPMSRIEGSIEIAAPRQAVWNVISDPTRHVEFGTFVREATLVSEGELGEGTIYREISGPGFMKSASEWTISTFDPPHELVHTQNGTSMTAKGTWILEEIDSGSTRVTQTLDFEMMPRFRPLGRLVEALVANRLGERETARMLQDVKRISESEAVQEGG